MSVARLSLLAILFLPTTAWGQVEKDEPDKVSNDRPDRPLQMPPASSETKEAFDDYERFRKRNAWERALKSLFGIPEASAARFVDGTNGFIIPVARKRRELLAGLPAEGKAAYRLFYDDDAKKLLDQSEGPAELKTLERIYSAYFPTSVGDNAADRLGDLYFEMGQFDRAAECWLAILREHPDTDLSPAMIMVKAGVSLGHAGRRSELATLRRELTERHAGEMLAIGGRSATTDEHLNKLLDALKGSPDKDSDGSRTTGAAEQKLDLSGPIPAAWRMRFGESIIAGMTPAERTQWDSNPLSSAVPAVAVVENTAYVNFLGYVFALNLNTGKLIWRSGSFHNIEIPAAQNQARMVDVKQFTIVASKNYVWSVGRDLKEQNYLAPYRLTCRRAEGGDIVWQTSDLPDYAQVDLVGVPVLSDGKLFVVAKNTMNQQQQGQGHQYVLAIRAQDGKLLWKTEIGLFRQGQRYFYYGMNESSAQPTLLRDRGSVFVDTHAGILARVDAESGELEWGYGYPTEAVQSNNRFFFSGMTPSKSSSASSTPMRSGESLFIKGAKSERIFALDSDTMKVLWDRPISKSARLLGVDDRAVYLGGPEISALDRKTRELLWATRLPGGSSDGRILVRSDGIWQLTPRGIFELDPRSGQVRRIFRGEDTGAEGGDLYLTGRLLLAVTNRAISAYPIAAPQGVGVLEKSRTNTTRGLDD